MLGSSLPGLRQGQEAARRSLPTQQVSTAPLVRTWLRDEFSSARGGQLVLLGSSHTWLAFPVM